MQRLYKSKVGRDVAMQRLYKSKVISILDFALLELSSRPDKRSAEDDCAAVLDFGLD
jgi:hypothetical protein